MKHALEVLARRSGFKIEDIGQNSRLLQDLRLDGDDAIDAILEISERFSMDISNFDAQLYFRSEPTILSLFIKAERIDSKRELTVGHLIEAAEVGRLT